MQNPSGALQSIEGKQGQKNEASSANHSNSYAHKLDVIRQERQAAKELLSKGDSFMTLAERNRRHEKQQANFQRARLAQTQGKPIKDLLPEEEKGQKTLFSLVEESINVAQAELIEGATDQVTEALSIASEAIKLLGETIY